MWGRKLEKVQIGSIWQRWFKKCWRASVRNVQFATEILIHVAKFGSNIVCLDFAIQRIMSYFNKRFVRCSGSWRTIRHEITSIFTRVGDRNFHAIVRIEIGWYFSVLFDDILFNYGGFLNFPWSNIFRIGLMLNEEFYF